MLLTKFNIHGKIYNIIEIFFVFSVVCYSMYIVYCVLFLRDHCLGVLSGRVTPVLISNTAVKSTNADDSYL